MRKPPAKKSGRDDRASARRLQPRGSLREADSSLPGSGNSCSACPLISGDFDLCLPSGNRMQDSSHLDASGNNCPVLRNSLHILDFDKPLPRKKLRLTFYPYQFTVQ